MFTIATIHRQITYIIILPLLINGCSLINGDKIGSIDREEPAAEVSLSKIEQDIVTETNRVRNNPQSYIQVMNDWKKKFNGKNARISDRTYLKTQEGTPAIDEAINYLKTAKPLPKLTISSGMSKASKDHVQDQGKTGEVGHNGSDKSTPFDRLNRHGKWQIIAGENISYGPNTGLAVVRDLIIDDGVSDRGHRHNIFQPKFRVIGVSCGPHKTYRIICVMTYAGGYQ
jgi:uncharacterized protein YkwD